MLGSLSLMRLTTPVGPAGLEEPEDDPLEEEGVAVGCTTTMVSVEPHAAKDKIRQPRMIASGRKKKERMMVGVLSMKKWCKTS